VFYLFEVVRIRKSEKSDAQFHPFPVENIEAFKQQLLAVSNHVKHFCYLDSNNYPNYPYSTFGSFFAIDAIDVFL
jgi:hypothetical protein